MYKNFIALLGRYINLFISVVHDLKTDTVELKWIYSVKRQRQVDKMKMFLDHMGIPNKETGEGVMVVNLVNSTKVSDGVKAEGDITTIVEDIINELQDNPDYWDSDGMRTTYTHQGVASAITKVLNITTAISKDDVEEMVRDLFVDGQNFADKHRGVTELKEYTELLIPVKKSLIDRTVTYLRGLGIIITTK